MIESDCLEIVQNTTLELIHYGANKYFPEKVTSIRDDHWIKPKGGLWTSPVNSGYGWRHWCEDNEFNASLLKKSFQLRFEGCLLTIDSVQDLEKLPWIDLSYGRCFPLWEAIEFCGVDAIHLTERGEQETRFSSPHNLYGWDCETVLVMNVACLSSLSKISEV